MGHFGKGKTVGPVMGKGWEEGLILEGWPVAAWGGGVKLLCNLIVGVIMHVFKFMHQKYFTVCYFKNEVVKF